MADPLARSLQRIGITGADATLVQFVLGVGLVAASLGYHTQIHPFFWICGTLFGAYLIIKAIQ